MRQKKRIPIVLEVFKSKEQKRKFLEHLFKPNEPVQLSLFERHPMLDIDDFIENWSENTDRVKELWIEYPDLRLTQVLANLGILPNAPGFWYAVEEVGYLIKSKILQPRDVLFWGQNYDKNMNRLEKTKFILIKDMAIDHIEAVLRDIEENKYTISYLYTIAFNKEIKIRKDGNKQI